MMKRREFLAASTALGLTPLAMASAQGTGSTDRDFIELRIYHIETEAQRRGFEKFASEAAVPALNRIGISPVGVFYPKKGLSPIYVILRHKSLDTFVNLVPRLSEDAEFLEKGAASLEAPASAAAYTRMESALLHAFTGMPHIDRPITTPGRIFQLRIYESPSVLTGQKKIEMFNDAGEMGIFRRVGLHAVFFGERLVGGKMPNVTYMLSFENEAQLKANWKKFVNSPGWQRLKTMDEYADKNILCKITNLLLKPAPCSQL